MSSATDALYQAAKAATYNLCQLCYFGVPFISTDTHQLPDGGIAACGAAVIRAALRAVETEAKQDPLVPR